MRRSFIVSRHRVHSGGSTFLTNQMSVTARIIVLCLISAAIGCSEFGGGAGVEPVVTFVPADAGTSPVNGAPADGAAEAVVATGASGTLIGRVVLTGTAPVLPLAVVAGSAIKDAAVCAAINLPDERLILGAENGVANVFVFLVKAPKGGKALEPSTVPIMFDQKNCQFVPHCLIAPVGGEVRVLSGDSVAHNTHTNPKKQTGISQVVSPMDRIGDAVRFQYKKAEGVPFTVTCDFHGWMQAYHLPLDHPYGALTDADGNFSIPDLPPGKHVFIVWHEAADGGFVERKLAVEIKSGETTETRIEYSADKLKLK